MQQHTRRSIYRRRKKVKRDDVIYKIKCEQSDKIYIGKIKFNMDKRMAQHKKDVQ